MGKSKTKKLKIVRSIEPEIGLCLREERLATGKSLADIARKLNVTKGYLSRIERSKAKPSKEMIIKIADILKIDPNPLFILCGNIPNDVKEILYKYPVEAPTVLRETFGDCFDSEKDKYHNTNGKKVNKSKRSRKSFSAETRSLYEVIQADCFKWMDSREPKSIHAVVTDPPYGLKEYTLKEKNKLRNGRGGVWRIPPAFDGCPRKPLPRFTVLTIEEKEALKNFIYEWATKVFRILVPGGHVFIATNPLLSQFVYLALIKSGFEKRGEIIRLVQTLRGGDRPKNAHKEFNNVTVMPRSCWEPWGLFRKPCEGRVQDNLRKWKTGGLLRISEDQPFCDVIQSSPTRSIEREIAPHPSLKPQAFMRQIVRAALPLEEGIILDPFMGGGATIAAASAKGYKSIGIESDPQFYNIAVQAIPKLTQVIPNGRVNDIRRNHRSGKNKWQADLFH